MLGGHEFHIQLQDVQVRIEGSADPFCCGCCWSACGHDRAADEHADLDCRGSDRSAAGFHRAERTGAKPSWNRVRLAVKCLCSVDDVAT